MVRWTPATATCPAIREGNHLRPPPAARWPDGVVRLLAAAMRGTPLSMRLEGAKPRPLWLSPGRAVMSAQAGRDGFVYTRDEMLAVYHRGKFKERDFTERFTHVPNVTTPEFLVPLAFIPMSEEEAKLRANPIAPLPTHQGGRAAGRGYDREGGRGKGRGRGGRGDGRGEPWGPRGSNDGQTNDEHGRLRHWESGDVRISGERASGGKDGAVDGLPSGGLPAPLIAPPPPKEWYYRDLEGIVQGPFAEEQISEWFRLSYLPGNLQMRCSDDPPDAYTPLRDMGAQPLFVRAHIARQKYSAELVRRQRDQLVRAAARRPAGWRCPFFSLPSQPR